MTPAGHLSRIDVVKVGQAAHAAMGRVHPAVEHDYLKSSGSLRISKFFLSFFLS